MSETEGFSQVTTDYGEQIIGDDQEFLDAIQFDFGGIFESVDSTNETCSFLGVFFAD
jgi:hypothetical protein